MQSLADAVQALAEQLKNAEAALACDGNERQALQCLTIAARDVVELWGA